MKLAVSDLIWLNKTKLKWENYDVILWLPSGWLELDFMGPQRHFSSIGEWWLTPFLDCLMQWLLVSHVSVVLYKTMYYDILVPKQEKSVKFGWPVGKFGQSIKSLLIICTNMFCIFLPPWLRFILVGNISCAIDLDGKNPEIFW